MASISTASIFIVNETTPPSSSAMIVSELFENVPSALNNAFRNKNKYNPRRAVQEGRIPMLVRAMGSRKKFQKFTYTSEGVLTTDPPTSEDRSFTTYEGFRGNGSTANPYHLLYKIIPGPFHGLRDITVVFYDFELLSKVRDIRLVYADLVIDIAESITSNIRVRKFETFSLMNPLLTTLFHCDDSTGFSIVITFKENAELSPSGFCNDDKIAILGEGIYLYENADEFRSVFASEPPYQIFIYPLPVVQQVFQRNERCRVFTPKLNSNWLRIFGNLTSAQRIIYEVNSSSENTPPKRYIQTEITQYMTTDPFTKWAMKVRRKLHGELDLQPILQVPNIVHNIEQQTTIMGIYQDNQQQQVELEQQLHALGGHNEGIMLL